FQAGFLNIGGFMACHRMVSRVTGFATFFGYEVSQSRYWDALGMLRVPIFFLLGAMVSAILVDIDLNSEETPKYYASFGLIFFLNGSVLPGGLLGGFGDFGESVEGLRDYVLIALLCFICGLQNAMVTSVS